MKIEAKAVVESVGGGAVEFRLVTGGMVNLPACRDEEIAWGAHLYEEVTVTVEKPARRDERR